MLAFFFLNPGKLVESADFAGYLDVNLRGIKARNAPHPAAPFEDGVGKRRSPQAVRTNHSHPCNHAASFHMFKSSKRLMERRASPPAHPFQHSNISGI